MATKPTKTALAAKVEALLDIAPLAQRYKQLEKEVKDGMEALGLIEEKNGIEIDGKGRVFISQGKRTTIPVDAVVSELGELLAGKIIKRSVVKTKFDSFCEAGVIDEESRDSILKQSKHTPVISLHVRPLN